MEKKRKIEVKFKTRSGVLSELVTNIKEILKGYYPRDFVEAQVAVANYSVRTPNPAPGTQTPEHETWNLNLGIRNLKPITNYSVATLWLEPETVKPGITPWPKPEPVKLETRNLEPRKLPFA